MFWVTIDLISPLWSLFSFQNFYMFERCCYRGYCVEDDSLICIKTMTSLSSLLAILDADILTMMASEILMSLLCEIVRNCQNAKDVSSLLCGFCTHGWSFAALFSSSQCWGTKHPHFSYILKLSSFYIYLMFSVLNEIACVFHDVRSLAILFNPLSFSHSLYW